MLYSFQLPKEFFVIGHVEAIKFFIEDIQKFVLEVMI